MKFDIHEFGSEKIVDSIDISDKVTQAPIRKDLVKSVVDWQLIKRMSGTHNSRTVSEISGTTKKPFKQKGTGRARQGSSRSPHMRGGSKVHGPSPRNRNILSLNKKIILQALSSAVSDKVSSKKMFVLSSFKDDSHKTRHISPMLSLYNNNGALFIYDDSMIYNKFKMAVSNIPHISFLPAKAINVYDILRHGSLVFTKNAIIQLEKRFLNDRT